MRWASLQLGEGPMVVLAFLSIFLLAGVVMFLGGLTYLRKYAQLVRTSQTDALEVSSGLVEVEGEALASEETFDAPFTGRECVAYEVEVEQYRSSGKGANWRTEVQGSEHVPFRLYDGTGSVGVDPAGANRSFEDDYQQIVDAGEHPPARIRAFLDDDTDVDHDTGSVDLGPVSLVEGHKHRFTERRIEPGTTAFVSGTADPMTAVDGETPTIGGSSGGRIRDALADPFLLANTDEVSVARRYLFYGLGMLVFGGMFSWIPLLLFYSTLA